MRVGVTGGTGFIGRHLIDRLLDEENQVVTISRGRQQIPEAWRSATDIEVVDAGITDTEGLQSAISTCDAIAHLAGINYERGSQTYRRVHIRGTSNVITAAEAADVDRLVLTSYLRARPGTRSGYLESKWAAEELVRTADVSGVILKPAAVFGPGDQLLTHLARVIETVRGVPRVGIRDRRLRPIEVSDLVDIMMEALRTDRLAGSSFGLMGPETLTQETLIRRIGTALNRRVLIIPTPVFGQYLTAPVLERLFDPPLVTRAGIRMLSEGMTHPAPPAVCSPVPDDLRPETAPKTDYIGTALSDVRGLHPADIRLPVGTRL